MPLPARVRFRVAGTDASRYLNGQLSADIRRARPGHALPALVLSPKGKICAPAFVILDSPDFLVEVPAEAATGALARLERYIVADDVSITAEPAPDGFHVIGCPPPPEALVVHRLGIPGFDTPAPPPGIPVLDSAAAESLRIRLGVPAWNREITPDTLPQEALLDQTHVHFGKGCYVGQETVSRLHSVGRTNRLLEKFSATQVQPSPSLPLALFDPSGNPAKPVGSITSVAPEIGMASRPALGYLLRNIDRRLSFPATDAEGRPAGQFTVIEP